MPVYVSNENATGLCSEIRKHLEWHRLFGVIKPQKNAHFELDLGGKTYRISVQEKMPRGTHMDSGQGRLQPSSGRRSGVGGAARA